MIAIPAFLSMLRRYKWYGAALGGVMGLASFIRNYRKYPGRSPLFLFFKSVGDSWLVLALAIVCPPLLIALCVTWLLQFVKGDAVWKTIAGVLSGIAFTILGGWLLEALLLSGIFAMDLVTGKAVRHWGESRELPSSTGIYPDANRI